MPIKNLGRNILSKLMKPGPVPKIFDHLDMNAAIKGIYVLGVVLLFISGCSQPVPDLKSVYIKDWVERKLWWRCPCKWAENRPCGRSSLRTRQESSDNASANGYVRLLRDLAIFRGGRSFSRKSNWILNNNSNCCRPLKRFFAKQESLKPISRNSCPNS